MKKRSLLFFVLIPLMMLSCGFPGEVKKLNEKIDDLTAQLNQRPDNAAVEIIQKQADQYKTENEELKNEIKNLRLENEILNTRIQDLAARREALIGQIDDMLR